MADGTIVTFYSYKGGVGRSFALANVAVALASWGYRVLCIDWDLEAPGLTHYFGVDGTHPGLVDLVLGVRAASSGEGGGEPIDARAADRAGQPPDPGRGARPGGPDWRDYLTRARPAAGAEFDLIAAGRQDGEYIGRVQGLQWADLYENRGLARALEDWRREWKGAYDFTLIDSRTGVTDIGAICTAHLPDILAVLFTANNQSIDGCVEVVDRAIAARRGISFDRPALHVLPIPSRFDAREEYKRAEEWRSIFEAKAGRFLASWVEVGVAPGDLIGRVTIPYVAYWSFGEGLPMLEEAKRSPDSIRSPLETIAAILAHRMGDSGLLIEGVEGYIRAAVRAGRRLDGFAYNLFLSSTPDLDGKAREVRVLLEGRGYTVFVDDAPRPNDGSEADVETERAPARAQHGVFLIGREPSPGMEAELRRFARQLLDEQANRVVLPIAFYPNRPHSLPSLIRKSLAVADPGDPPSALADLIARELNLSPADEAPEPEAPPDVRLALARLDSPNPLARKASVATLGRVGGPRVFEKILGRLGDIDERVRGEAMAAALDVYRRSGWSAQDAPAQLQPLIASSEPELRATAVEMLATIGGAKASEPLIGMLNDTSPSVVAKAADALGRIGDPRTVYALLELTTDNSPAVRAAAATALGRIGDPASIDWLVVCLHDDDPTVRQAAAGALVGIDDPRSVGGLLDLVSGRKEGASLIAKALGGPGGGGVLDALVARLGDDRVSAPIRSVLTRIDPALVGLHLAAALSVGASMTRGAAAEALGEIGGPAAIEGLTSGLADRDRDVRVAVIRALGRLGGPRAVEGLIPMLKDPEAAAREAAATALAQIGDARATEPLLAAFADVAPGVRAAATEALGRLGGPEVVEALISRLHDEDPGVREQSVLALGRMRDPDTIGGLIGGLADESEGVRRAAAEALGEIGDPEAITDLISCLDDESPAVRVAAARALGPFGTPAVSAALFGRFNDPSPAARGASLQALAEAMKLDAIDHRLLSRDLDGLAPFVDPQSPIPSAHILHASSRIGIPTGEIMIRLARINELMEGRLKISAVDATGKLIDRDREDPSG